MESKRLLVKAYSIPHNLEVNELIEDYMRILNSILEDLWKNIEWKRRGKRLIPFLNRGGRDTFMGGLKEEDLS
ncbi:MAG: hypothetical protein QXN53_01790 [Thermoproteota archaeon]